MTNHDVSSSPSSGTAGIQEDPSPQQLYASRVVLTTYPSQHGIDPIPLHWGAKTAAERGPVVASRQADSFGKRNAIGAGGGSYCIYRALAVAIGALGPNHRPDFRMTEPTNVIGPFPSWSDPEKIVSMDPWGHAIVEHYSEHLEKGVDVRPTIAITKAHMKLAEIDEVISKGGLHCDGDIITAGGELKVVKVASEPVWYIPGVAKRFGISEATLRRALFEDTGGMYPELITRPDLKVFLPPIGGLTVYIFGNPDYISDPTKRLTMRVHDECNGSDVFGSDICTCKPYLIYSIEECAREAQNGGVGVVVYFRKEGRALGEVTKYLVYNARKRQEGGDTAANYFKRTEFVAGVKDMRFQALMPDILHWLGVSRIDRFISMSNMKYEAIVNSGIEIVERVSIPEERMPADSKVEIEAKIADGYFTTGEVPTSAMLESVKGRNWDEIAH
ncbi:Uracil-regulated protein 1 [Coemansia sp. RSA 2708]|nr:Uracil-regulated protein 1 [Coemansia sp. RSA 2708]KAJ2302195.1 Uracil-regulated protein 1 [Coemansia sp. RSA 2705]KAJ2319302.1 Uracil-regulated protein 1 [Coemansia sp. RSA 2704]KAJ2360813.1 Uracil-regulated protein 1 [Coemansia sp. RSA 2610]KAJ2715016.1 Uracil-regulated protein 1 [Coemansia sp. Cherry 401B]